MQVTVARHGEFAPARQPDQALQALRTQLAKTGDTIYDVVSVEVDQDTVRFVPISLLNELRREAVAGSTGCDCKPSRGVNGVPNIGKCCFRQRC